MRIEASSATGNIQSIANSAIQNAAPAPAPVVLGSSGRSFTTSDGSSDLPVLLEQAFGQNLSERLKDPEMKKEFDNVLQYANKLLFNENNVLKFSRHEATNTTLVKLVDSKTNEVLREFPPEKILNIIAGIWEVAGLVVNEKA